MLKKIAIAGALLLIVLPAFADTFFVEGQKVNVRQVGVTKTLFTSKDGSVDTIYVSNTAPGPPSGQVVGGISFSDSSGHALRLDSNGSLQTYDFSRDRNNTFAQSIIGGVNGTVMKAGASDSSAVLDVRPYRYLKIVYQITMLDSLNTSSTSEPFRFAVQFRENVNNQQDSLNTAAAYTRLYANIGNTTTITTTADTSLAGHLTVGSATACWSGEKELIFDRSRSTLTTTALAFSYPTSVYEMVQTPYMNDRFQYFSVRIRLLSFAGNAETAAQGVRAVVRVWLLGWS